MSGNHTGQVSNSILIEEHTMPFGEGKVAAKSVIEYIPAGTLTQKFLDYDVRSDSNPVYVGFNLRGALTSDANWLLQKLTYDGSNRVTTVQVAIDSWTNRTTTTYS